MNRAQPYPVRQAPVRPAHTFIYIHMSYVFMVALWGPSNGGQIQWNGRVVPCTWGYEQDEQTGTLTLTFHWDGIEGLARTSIYTLAARIGQFHIWRNPQHGGQHLVEFAAQ